MIYLKSGKRIVRHFSIFNETSEKIPILHENYHFWHENSYFFQISETIENEGE